MIVGAGPARGTRKTIRPPSGFEDHLCRRDAAALLGFASEFKVRQLEKEGRLRPIRGAMGSAWYPRREIEALRATSARPSSPSAAGLRWPDDALIALLREKPRTVVDLVVDAGILDRARRARLPLLAGARGCGDGGRDAGRSNGTLRTRDEDGDACARSHASRESHGAVARTRASRESHGAVARNRSRARSGPGGARPAGGRSHRAPQRRAPRARRARAPAPRRRPQGPRRGVRQAEAATALTVLPARRARSSGPWQ